MKKEDHEDIFTWLVGLAIGATLTLVAVTWLKLIWPSIRYIAVKAFQLLMKRLGRAKVEEVKETEELPTPDIFKGAKNLARARQMTY